MKKVFLALTVIGLVSLTSCKNDKAETAQDNSEEIQETVQDAQEEAADVAQDNADVAAEIPTFSNPELQTFAQDYAKYFEEVKAAASTGDQTKIMELQKKAVEWSQKQQQILSKGGVTPEDAQKLNDWVQKLASNL